MKSQASAPPSQRYDALAYVRTQMAGLTKSDYMRLALDAGVSMSTVYNVLKRSDMNYSSVKKLEGALIAQEIARNRKAQKGEQAGSESLPAEENQNETERA